MVGEFKEMLSTRLLNDLRTTPKLQMPREVEPSLDEKQFILRALQENLRIDGRTFDQFRELDLTFGDEYGVTNIKLGKTMSVSLTLELTKY
jgi:exosome complex component RRP45